MDDFVMGSIVDLGCGCDEVMRDRFCGDGVDHDGALLPGRYVVGRALGTESREEDGVLREYRSAAP